VLAPLCAVFRRHDEPMRAKDRVAALKNDATALVCAGTRDAGLELGGQMLLNVGATIGFEISSEAGKGVGGRFVKVRKPGSLRSGFRLQGLSDATKG